MSVIQHPTRGLGHWYITLGRGKNRITIPFEGTHEDALDYEKSKRRSRGLTTNDADPRLREISEDYLRTYKLDHMADGHARQVRSVTIVVAFFGNYNLSSITPALIEHYKYKRLETVKAITINKELCALSGIFKWALQEKRTDYMPKIKKFPPKLTLSPVADIPMRETVLELLPHISAKTRGMFRLMFLYGLRSKEARLLKDTNVNLSARTFWVTGKGGKIRTLPIMDDETFSDLQDRCKNATNGWLWYSPWSKGPYTCIGNGLKLAAKRAGIPTNMYPHLLRHCAGTELVGITDLRTAQAILGHTTITTTEKYLHVRQDRISAALAGHSNETHN